jgi:cell wall-associated NlpC family hydrolase
VPPVPRPSARARRVVACVVVVLAAAGVALGCGAVAPGPEPAARVAAVPAVKPKATAPRPVAGDAEIDQSYALPAGVKAGPLAPQPGDAPAAKRRSAKATATTGISPGAPSDAQIRRELKQMDRVLRGLRRAGAGRRAGLTRGGNAETPYGAPDRVARVIAGGNAIARFPYIWGGGHGSFVDQGYDCSGSVSYALAAAGLLGAPLTSGQLAHWGAPGPGRWITIYANGGHTFMYVAGLRFDTSGRSGPLGSRWQAAPRSLAGFMVRHPPGL